MWGSTEPGHFNHWYGCKVWIRVKKSPCLFSEKNISETSSQILHAKIDSSFFHSEGNFSSETSPENVAFGKRDMFFFFLFFFPPSLYMGNKFTMACLHF